MDGRGGRRYGPLEQREVILRCRTEDARAGGDTQRQRPSSGAGTREGGRGGRCELGVDIGRAIGDMRGSVRNAGEPASLCRCAVSRRRVQGGMRRIRLTECLLRQIVQCSALAVSTASGTGAIRSAVVCLSAAAALLSLRDCPIRALLADQWCHQPGTRDSRSSCPRHRILRSCAALRSSVRSEGLRLSFDSSTCHCVHIYPD